MDAKKVLAFLSELRENNNREWFAERKSEFDALRKEFEDTTQYIINEIATLDVHMRGVEAKNCVYRIYRDTRFHDKTPYKTHFAAYMAKGGRKSVMGAYYLHLEPGASFLCGGIYAPEPDILNKLRTNVSENCDEMMSILSSQPFSNYFKELYGEKLKRLPLKFAKTEIANPELLKHKHFIVEYRLEDSFFSKPDWVEQAVELLKITYPFNKFLNEVFD